MTKMEEDFSVSIKDEIAIINIDETYVSKKNSETDFIKKTLKHDNSVKKIKPSKDVNKKIKIQDTKIGDACYEEFIVIENSPNPTKLKSTFVSSSTMCYSNNIFENYEILTYDKMLELGRSIDHDLILNTLIEGVDQSERSKIWLFLCNICNKLDIDKFYEKLNAKYDDDASKKIKAILKKDIPRTNFCKIDESKEKIIDEKLEKMLLYYLKQQHKNEYFEGITNILKAILLVIDDDDKKAYAFFEHMLKDLNISEFVNGQFSYIKKEIRFIVHLLKKHHFEYFEFLNKLGVS